MIKFDLRLKQETIDSIKELAEKEERSVSAMARKILTDYFKPTVDFQSIDDYQRSLIYGGTRQGKEIAEFIDQIKIQNEK